MIAKVFIIGLPGSGKSALVRYIEPYIRKKRIRGTRKRWFTKRFNDYSILNAMANDVNEKEYFQPAETGGFDVIDEVAFDIALERLELVITNYISSKKKNKAEIIIIEFARNDYQRAFSQFNKSFLRDASIIYLGADVKICKQRVNERASEQKYPDDDYPVSDYIFENYYHSDDGEYLADFLEQDFGIARQRVLLIDNNHSLQEAIERFMPFIVTIFDFVSSREDSILFARSPLDSM
jgi:thymidylate kinase